MASVETVLELVKAIKRNYESVTVLKRACKEARNLAETVGEVVSAMGEEGIEAPLRALEVALGEMKATLEVCGTKQLQAVAFSKTYLFALRSATGEIRDVLGLLSGFQEAREEAQEVLARLPDELRSAVATEIRAALDAKDAAGLLKTLRERGLANDADDARRQLRELQQGHAALRADAAFQEGALLDAICALSVEDPPAPEHFVCPITQDVMNDPVILNTAAGRSYEREALVEWLRRNPYKDPVTGVASFEPLGFTPNRSLLEAICEWRRRHPAAHAPPKPACRPAVRYAGTADAASQLVAAGDSETRQSAARALAAFCDNWTADNKIAARAAGAIPPLVAMLRRAPEADAAALALWKLSREDGNKVAIANAGAIPPLVVLVTSGTDVVKENAAAALMTLAVNNDGVKVAIVDAAAIPPLVLLIESGTTGAKEKAAATLRNLAVHNSNKVLIAKAGGIPPLVNLVRRGASGAKEQAAAALWNLAFNNNDNVVAIDEAGAIPPLVELAKSGSDEAKAFAAGALDALYAQKFATGALDVLSARAKSHSPRRRKWYWPFR